VPAGITFWMSLTESSLTRTSAFVGLANYRTLLNDPSFWDSVAEHLLFRAADRDAADARWAW
jgi:multiple sugar transport system permease protein